MSLQFIEVISGGQAGVDRAALDMALEKEMSCSGWCPRGRIAEDGEIDQKYPLKETETESPEERTALNVRACDGTLVIHNGSVDKGTAYTITQCMIEGKPVAEVDLSETYNTADFKHWLNKWDIRKLNVAGPRESASPGIYEQARLFLERLFKD